MINKIINISSIQKPKRFSAYSYIQNEFFNADWVTFNKITNLYYDLYGYGPQKYLLDTYYSWKSGSVSTSGRTMSRIIECVPRFLSDEKRFFILKNEIIYFVENLYHKQQNKEVSLYELNTVFENYATQIENFNKSDLPYMVGDRIFTEEEIQHFLLVCKYALFEKLNLVYRQVQSDLILIKNKLSNFNTGIFKASYLIDFLNSKIDLSNINEKPLNFIQLKKQEIKPEGTYKEFVEQYILEEFMKMSFSEKEGEINHFVNTKDLDFFISQYHEISDNKNEATLKSVFNGEGGQFILVLEIKSLKKIQSMIFLSGMKLFLYTSIIVFVVILIITFKLYKEVVWVIFGALIFGGILLKGFESELNKIKELKLDLKRYGK